MGVIQQKQLLSGTLGFVKIIWLFVGNTWYEPPLFMLAMSAEPEGLVLATWKIREELRKPKQGLQRTSSFNADMIESS